MSHRYTDEALELAAIAVATCLSRADVSVVVKAMLDHSERMLGEMNAGAAGKRWTAEDFARFMLATAKRVLAGAAS